MSRQERGRVGRRLRRILVMIPYIVRHPGATLDELANKFGVEREKLAADLELVFLCGLPGYTPADLIDVRLEGDRVFVDMADYFGTPLRLTPAEALSLYAGGAALLELPGMEHARALERAMAKLAGALGPGVAESVRVRVEAGPAEHIETIQHALSERRRIRLQYHSATRGELTEREVDPWGLVAALGRLYLVGLDHLSGEERMFRTDRVKAAAATDVAAEVPEDFDPERYKGGFSRRGETTISLEISPQAGRWFEDYYPVASTEALADGWTRVSLVTSGTRWAATLVLRLGRHARSVEPAEVSEAARSLAGEIATLYR
jgi:proteasome accessory factor C